jgi:hypothetical protein
MTGDRSFDYAREINMLRSGQETGAAMAATGKNQI